MESVKMLPRLATDTRVTTNNTGDRAIDEQVEESTSVHKSRYSNVVQSSCCF